MTDADTMTPQDAASLILMRERAGDAPELLIVQRSASLAFAAGAYVFPGGRVDLDDRALVAEGHADPADAAARLAALRETHEETGIALAVAEDELVAFARWCPPIRETLPRRFDTRFYLALAEGDLPVPVADGGESSRVFWASAAEVIEHCLRGDGRAIYPTRRLLERLARFGSFAEAKADAECRPPRIISPWVEQRDGRKWLCIPEDAGYPITSELFESAFRS